MTHIACILEANHPPPPRSNSVLQRSLSAGVLVAAVLLSEHFQFEEKVQVLLGNRRLVLVAAKPYLAQAQVCVS